MVAPPFDGIAAVNKRGLDRLSAVQIGIALGQVEEMRVLSERLEGEHTHIGRLVLLDRLAHALVVRAGIGHEQRNVVHEAVFLPN